MKLAVATFAVLTLVSTSPGRSGAPSGAEAISGAWFLELGAEEGVEAGAAGGFGTLAPATTDEFAGGTERDIGAGTTGARADAAED